ncbi:MAG: hypothetical protein MK212_10430 [Saprospiraceae bacterium]|nr:hypothetical protein [Saprospiraceae bacterium]
MEEDYAKIDRLLFSGLEENIDLAFTLVKSLGLDLDRVMADFYTIGDFLVDKLEMFPRTKLLVKPKNVVSYLTGLTNIYLSKNSKIFQRKAKKIKELPTVLYEVV